MEEYYGYNDEGNNRGGGTTFSASPAIVSVPTGETTISDSGQYFTFPNGVIVIKVYSKSIPDFVSYVGITSGSQHTFKIYRDDVHSYSLVCIMDDVNWLSDAETRAFVLSWSPEINTHKPDVTDY